MKRSKTVVWKMWYGFQQWPKRKVVPDICSQSSQSSHLAQIIGPGAWDHFPSSEISIAGAWDLDQGSGAEKCCFSQKGTCRVCSYHTRPIPNGALQNWRTFMSFLWNLCIFAHLMAVFCFSWATKASLHLLKARSYSDKTPSAGLSPPAEFRSCGIEIYKAGKKTKKTVSARLEAILSLRHFRHAPYPLALAAGAPDHPDLTQLGIAQGQKSTWKRQTELVLIFLNYLKLRPRYPSVLYLWFRVLPVALRLRICGLGVPTSSNRLTLAENGANGGWWPGAQICTQLVRPKLGVPTDSSYWQFFNKKQYVQQMEKTIILQHTTPNSCQILQRR